MEDVEVLLLCVYDPASTLYIGSSSVEAFPKVKLCCGTPGSQLSTIIGEELVRN